MCSSLIAGLHLSELMFGFHYTTIFRTHLAQPNIFPQLNVVGLLNSAHECVRPSLLDFLFSDPPLPAAIVVVDCYCKIPPTNNFKLHVFFWKPIFTTQRYFEPISPSLTFFPQLNVVGLLNSAHECVRPSLLDFLFSDPPCRRPLLLLLIVRSHPLTISNCTYFLKTDFHYTTIFRTHLAQPNIFPST